MNHNLCHLSIYQNEDRQTVNRLAQCARRESGKPNLFDRTSVVFRTRTKLCFLLIAGYCLLASNCRALAQAAYVFPSSVMVGGTPLTETVAVTIQSSGTLASIQVLTQGSANLDFNLSGVSTCAVVAYVQGQVCSVSTIFAPTYP